MNWTKEAEDAVSRVPFFVKKRVRKRVEEEAARQGSREVNMGHVRTCQKRYLSDMEEEVAGFQVETCFGPSGCPNRAAADDGMASRIEELLKRKNLRAFLIDKVKGSLKMHHEFRVSISDCPNACSRPQIADIGLIGASNPAVGNESCSGCGACVEACREEAVELSDADSGPAIDYDRCLLCGKCCKACPTGTLSEAKRGWRIIIGGKLGRHPQLGRELEGIFLQDEALTVIDMCIDFYMKYAVEGERFGEVINKAGFKAVENFLDVGRLLI